ncbi:MAG: hypothetical protein COA67_07370 [Lutibacter sp.]|nr:MAG: hypothetical protein COA67_07370 [Lutibacter sp.]
MAIKKYNQMIFVAHSYLEVIKKELVYNNNSTAEDFETYKINQEKTKELFDYFIKDYEYELSYHQMMKAISLFLKSNKQ